MKRNRKQLRKYDNIKIAILICVLFLSVSYYQLSALFLSSPGDKLSSNETTALTIYFHMRWPTHMSIGVNGKVFSYGQGLNRRQFKSLGSTGDGILYERNEADYLKGFTDNKESIRMFALQIPPKVAQQLETDLRKKEINPTVNGGYNISKYYFLGNNCADNAIASLPNGNYKTFLLKNAMGIPWLGCLASTVYDKFHKELTQLPTIHPEVIK